ncbi:MAG: hypothetical protein JSU96_16985 [Acidobacteriota bacterium]|nr:MAG: hypothetical protein JSU96_16985 [Acidobacteriota bacterium]
MISIIGLMVFGSVLAGRSRPLPARVVFADAAGDAIRSDGGPYVDGESFEGIPIKVGVSSSSGALGFTTYESVKPQDPWVGRPILYDFNLGSDGLPAMSPVGTTYEGAVQWILIVKDSSGTEDWPGGLLAMSVDETLPANLTANFRYGPDNDLYSLRFHHGYPNSDQLWVACVAEDLSGCIEWTIASEGVGSLWSGGSTVHEGDYWMPFEVTLSLITSDSGGGDGGGKPGKGKGKNR